MESGVVNARDCGVTPGVGYGETNRIALQRAVDEMRAAGGGTVLIRTGIYDLAGAINVEVSSTASATGSVRIRGVGDSTLVQCDGNNLFVVTDACDESTVGHAVFEGLHFQRSLEAATP